MIWLSSFEYTEITNANQLFFIVFLLDERQRASIRGSVEGLVTDPTSALTRELLSIQLDMVTYQQDRKQLRYEICEIVVLISLSFLNAVHSDGCVIMCVDSGLGKD